MKRKHITAALLCLAFFVCGYLIGFNAGREKFAIGEYKVTSANYFLQEDLPDSSPQLKEYFKARMYFLANRMPQDWIPRNADFGPVDPQLLTNIAIGKGPTSGPDEYELFRQRQKSPK